MFSLGNSQGDSLFIFGVTCNASVQRTSANCSPPAVLSPYICRRRLSLHAARWGQPSAPLSDVTRLNCIKMNRQVQRCRTAVTLVRWYVLSSFYDKYTKFDFDNTGIPVIKFQFNAFLVRIFLLHNIKGYQAQYRRSLLLISGYICIF